MGQQKKPVLFCDFDGVLCFDRYWRSLDTEKHGLIQSLFFGPDRTIVNDWMRGRLTAEFVNMLAASHMNVPYDWLWNLFVEDCKNFRVNNLALQMLNDLKRNFVVILVTDNMDSFSRFTVPSLKLEQYFDGICNSYYEQLLKTDDAGRIFADQAAKFGASLAQCLLFDDLDRVCGVFNKLGGKSYRVTKENSIVDLLLNLRAHAA